MCASAATRSSRNSCVRKSSNCVRNALLGSVGRQTAAATTARRRERDDREERRAPGNRRSPTSHAENPPLPAFAAPSSKFSKGGGCLSAGGMLCRYLFNHEPLNAIVEGIRNINDPRATG